VESLLSLIKGFKKTKCNVERISIKLSSPERSRTIKTVREKDARVTNERKPREKKNIKDRLIRPCKFKINKLL
jgi:hypothetical protein